MTTVSTLSDPLPLGAADQGLSPGTEVGEYRIERVLGKGGFGTVYGAVQPVIGKQVAIKVLARKYSADPAIVSRFVAEARAVNQIRHRHIIDIFSFGQLGDGRHYYVMEYLDGDPLDRYLREHGPMSLDDALPVLRSIAKALDAAHAKGIAHRDLKPENIFLVREPDGAVFAKLLDFGIAKLLTDDDADEIRHKTNTGVPLGTPYYMSPEQCRGREVDHRTDVYSFGIVVYRVLTGTFPFDGDDYLELLHKQVNEEPPPPSTRNPELSSTVDDAIAWMMRKDRTQRPPSVIEAVTALDPTATLTPSIPPAARGSKPTVPPRDARSVSADALAATFTPEFERPVLETSSIATKPAQKKSPALPIALAGAVVIAGALAAYVAFMRTPAPRPTAPAAVAPAPTPAPTPTPPPAAAVTPPTQPEPNREPPETTVTIRHAPRPPVPPRPASGSGSAVKPTGTIEPGIGKDTSHDTIQLGSDAFHP